MRLFAEVVHGFFNCTQVGSLQLGFYLLYLVFDLLFKVRVYLVTDLAPIVLLALPREEASARANPHPGKNQNDEEPQPGGLEVGERFQQPKMPPHDVVPQPHDHPAEEEERSNAPPR